MGLPQFALRHPAIVICFTVVALIWGVVSYQKSPRSENPEFTIRTATVVTQWSGQSAEKIEELITTEIEKSVDAIDEVMRVRSTTTTGQSVVFIDLEDWVDEQTTDNVWDKIRAKVDALAPSLTRLGASAPIVNTGFGDTAVMVLAVYQNKSSKRWPGQPDYSWRELEVIADEIRDEIKRLPSVAQVDLHAVRDQSIFLEVDAGQWSQLKLTINELKTLVEQRNVVAPGGTIDTESGQLSVKTTGELNAVEELNRLVVDRLPSGAPVYLRDLGLVPRLGYEEPASVKGRYRRLLHREINDESDGPNTPQRMDEFADCVVISFTMKDGGIVTELGDEVRSLLTQLKESALPRDIEIAVVSDQPSIVAWRIADFLTNLGQAVLIVIIVAFLMIGLRIAMVMAAAIPIVIVVSFGIVRFFDVQIEQISIASFIIALGMLVDCAIEVCDNVHRFLEEGKSRKEAAIEGTRQIQFPVLIATLTTVFAFLPMLTLPGGSGEFLYSMPIVVATALMVSWVLAMTVTCLMAYALMRPKQGRSPLEWFAAQCRKLRKNPNAGSVGDLYMCVVGTAVRMKFVTVGVALIVFIAAMSLIATGKVGSQFFPNAERDQFVVDIMLPEGSTIAQADAKAKEVETLIAEISDSDGSGAALPLVRDMVTYVGEGGPRFYLSLEIEQPKPNYAMILVNTTDKFETERLAESVRAAAAKRIASCRVTPRLLAMGPPVRAPISIRVMGEDRGLLRQFADQAKQIVRDTGLAWDIHDTWGNLGYQVLVDINEDDAKLAGVTHAAVAQTTNAYFSGHYLSTYIDGDHQIPVYLRLPSDQRGMKQLASVFVEGERGKVPIDAVADIDMHWVPTRIERYEKRRNMEVRARPNEGVLANSVIFQARKRLDELSDALPSGYTLEVGGEQEETSKSQGNMKFAFQISLLLIIVCLVIQYNNFSKPIMILITLPLAATGAIVGLYITGDPLGFMAMLGLLSLCGVVLNDAIVLIEFAEELIREKVEEGKDVPAKGKRNFGGLTRTAFRDCLVRAGRMRMLPIFLTTFTTVGGLIPLAITGGDFWRPLAVVIIFGLLFATMMTLVVLPSLYAILVEVFRVKAVRTEQN